MPYVAGFGNDDVGYFVVASCVEAKTVVYYGRNDCGREARWSSVIYALHLAAPYGN